MAGETQQETDRGGETGDAEVSDSRFHEGYTWCSSSSDCKVGLCMSGVPAEVARKYLSNKAAHYFNRGKTFTVYTLESATAQPVKHEITL
jgi:hypothetical protein